jgi:acyl-CoA thioesterase-1
MKKPALLALATSTLATLVLLAITSAHADKRTVLVVGDSLSSAYRIPFSAGWVYLLQQRLEEQRHGYDVVNASVSGSTTDGGLARLPRLLDVHDPDIVVLELGANDGLRRHSLEKMKHNLSAMVAHAKRRGAQVLLVGIRLPLDYENSYRDGFMSVYRQVASEQNVPLVPLFLQGIDENRSLFQRDGKHPTAEAQPRLLDNVWAQLKNMIEPANQTAGSARHSQRP